MKLNFLLFPLLSISQSKPLCCWPNQHLEWKYRPLGQRRGIISACRMPLLSVQAIWRKNTKVYISKDYPYSEEPVDTIYTLKTVSV